MITTFCLWWIGIKSDAPKWYFAVLIAGLCIRFANSVTDAKRNRKIRECLK